MKSLILTTLIAATSITAIAEGPLIAGERDLIIDFQGNNAIGMRQTLDSQKAAYVVLDSFSTSKVRDYNYNGTSQDLLDTTKDFSFQILAGMQYYLDDQLFGFGEVGYSSWSSKLNDADPAASDWKVKESGLVFAAGVGIEQSVTDKLSVVAKSKLQLKNLKYSGDIIPPAGASLPLGEEKWGTKSVIYSLGLTYKIQ